MIGAPKTAVGLSGEIEAIQRGADFTPAAAGVGLANGELKKQTSGKAEQTKALESIRVDSARAAKALERLESRGRGPVGSGTSIRTAVPNTGPAYQATSPATRNPGDPINRD